jgi:uncharacterized protein YbjQ (UPF0145 family)
MAAQCVKCSKTKNILNEHKFKKIYDSFYCIDCYPKVKSKLDEDISKIIITTTDTVEEYRIVKYLGVDSAEVVIGTGILIKLVSELIDFIGEGSSVSENKLQEAKTLVFNKLKKKAVDAGCNAILGADLDYTVFSSNRVGVAASGTLVEIVKMD